MTTMATEPTEPTACMAPARTRVRRAEPVPIREVLNEVWVAIEGRMEAAAEREAVGGGVMQRNPVGSDAISSGR
jgi:hypothetical protein